jgi:hypothetical protein
MERINLMTETHDTTDKQEITALPVFGLRYLEDEATEIHDVVGCLAPNNLMFSGCDEHVDNV